jgi:hypothetical protein
VHENVRDLRFRVGRPQAAALNDKIYDSPPNAQRRDHLMLIKALKMKKTLKLITLLKARASSNLPRICK